MENEIAEHSAHDLATGQELLRATTAPPSMLAMNPMMMSPANIGITFTQQQMLGTAVPHQVFAVPQILHLPSFIPPENTVYVNRRQYQRIEKRREERRVLSAYYERCRRGKKRPNPNYMHESRHRHAQNRPRNRKGHFMKGPELAEYYQQHPDKAPNNKNNKSLAGSSS